MENKNKILIVLLVIFITTTICLGGYIAYQESKTKTKENTNSNEKVDTEETNQDTTDNEKNDTEEADKYTIEGIKCLPDSTLIINKGSVYININDHKTYWGTYELDDMYGEGTHDILEITRNNYKEYDFEYSEVDNNSFKGQKLNVTGVKGIYSYNRSQQAVDKNNGLIILKNDKTVSIISLYSMINGIYDVKDVGLHDIIDIVHYSWGDDEISNPEYPGRGTTYAVKQSGEKINLDDYIPEDYTKY